MSAASCGAAIAARTVEVNDFHTPKNQKPKPKPKPKSASLMRGKAAVRELKGS